MARMLGEVDLLGLEAFSKANLLNDMTIGVGAGYALVKAAGAFTKPGIGRYLAAVGVPLVAAFVPQTKHLAPGAAVGAILASGLIDTILGKLFGLAGMSVPMSGLGLPGIDLLNGGLGLPDVSWESPVYGANLGLPTIAPVPPSYGTWNNPGPNGFAGPQLGSAPPVDLLGQPTSQTQQLELMGGPTTSGLSAMYGATLFGPNS